MYKVIYNKASGGGMYEANLAYDRTTGIPKISSLTVANYAQNIKYIINNNNTINNNNNTINNNNGCRVFNFDDNQLCNECNK